MPKKKLKMEVIKDKIIKTYIISMEVEMLSTFCIGSGESNKYDIEVVKLPNGMPYIPFTAWMGALSIIFGVIALIICLQILKLK